MATLFVQLQLVARFRLLLTMAQSISPTPCIVTFPLFPLHQAHQLVFIREGKKGEMRASLLGKVPSPKLGVRSGSPLPSSRGHSQDCRPHRVHTQPCLPLCGKPGCHVPFTVFPSGSHTRLPSCHPQAPKEILIS